MKRIFQQSETGEIEPLQLNPPDRENKLQELISRHPQLISLEDEELLLVRREIGASGTEAHGQRWSLDHLFITPTAIPVLVEVKRAVDTRIRREVVGQMLDYAANGSTYWTAASMAQSFSETYDRGDQDPDEVLRGFIPSEMEPLEFWEQAQTNLRAGHIKLRFVADQIPDELARVVSFLNAHFDLDVLAIEIGSYEGDSGERTLISDVIGQVEKISRGPFGSREPNALLQEVLSTFNTLDCELSTRSLGSGNYVQLRFGDPKIHFEWIQKMRPGRELHVAVHFEGNDRDENIAGAESVRDVVEKVALEFNVQTQTGEWGNTWASAAIVFPIEDTISEDLPEKAANAMVKLVQAALPILRRSLPSPGGSNLQ